jgi:7,8-dihydroneopterin aldolase/epimerase/oxygenase
MKTTDAILIKDLQAFCRLGIYDSERILGQCINIQLELEFCLDKVAKSDNVKDSINYVEVSISIRELAQSRDFLTIENLALEIIQMLFAKFNILEGVLIEITKTIVNADQFTGTPAIRMHRTKQEL